MIRSILLFVLISGFTTGIFPCTKPEARAIDPVTIAILAPIAIKAAQIAAPYVIRYFKNCGRYSVKLVQPFINLFKLPLGLLMVTLGIPFRGAFKAGCQFLIQGFIAPFQLCWYTMMLPVSGFGFLK